MSITVELVIQYNSPVNKVKISFEHTICFNHTAKHAEQNKTFCNLPIQNGGLNVFGPQRRVMATKAMIMNLVTCQIFSREISDSAFSLYSEL